MSARALWSSSLVGAALLIVLGSTVGAVTDRTITIDAASYSTDGYAVTSTSAPTLTASLSAGDPAAIVFSSADTGVCTVDSSTGAVTLVRGGQCEITAEVPVDSTYAAASHIVSFPVFDFGTVVEWNKNSSPVVVTGALAGLTVTDVTIGADAANNNYTRCAVAADRAFCWGENADGQLGIGTTADTTSPVAVLTTDVDARSELPGDATVLRIATSTAGHTCAIARSPESNATLYCWGDNTSGQLGLGPDGATTASSSFPLHVYLVDGDGNPCECEVTDVAVGHQNTCAIIGGFAYCWGNNSSGVLGNGAVADAAHHYRSAVITDALDDALVVVSELPHSAIPTQITMSRRTACVVADGSAYCWGNARYGQLGDGVSGSGKYSTVPKLVDNVNFPAGSSITAIATGARHSYDDHYFTCAIGDNGASAVGACTGANLWGQLGLGAGGSGADCVPTMRSRLKPLNTDASACSYSSQLPADAEVTAVAVGFTNACVVADGTPYCWGANNMGGSTGKSEAPRAVNTTGALLDVDVIALELSGHENTDNRAIAIRQYTRAPQTISMSSITDREIGSGDVAATASATSGLDVTLVSDTASVCSLSGTTVQLLAVGTCRVTASQRGNGEWAPADDVTVTFQVTAIATSSTSTSTSSSTTSSTTSSTSTTTTAVAETPAETSTPSTGSADSSAESAGPAVATTSTAPATTTSTALSQPAARNPEAAQSSLLVVEAGGAAVALESHDENGNAITNDGSAIWAEPGGRIEIATGRTTNPVRITIVRSDEGEPSLDIADEIKTEVFIPAPIILSCRGHILLPSDLPPGEYALVISVDGEEVVITLIVSDDELATIETSLEPGATQPDASIVPVIDFMILEIPEAEFESVGAGVSTEVAIALTEDMTTAVVAVQGFAPNEAVVALDASERVIGGGTADGEGRAEVAFLTTGLRPGNSLSVLGLQSGVRITVAVVTASLPSTGGHAAELMLTALLATLVGAAMVATKRR